MDQFRPFVWAVYQVNGDANLVFDEYYGSIQNNGAAIKEVMNFESLEDARRFASLLMKGASPNLRAVFVVRKDG